MTTWHADESLEDAVAFFLDSAQPAAAYANEPCSLVVACVGPLGASVDVVGALRAHGVNAAGP
jgi:hypothetical protein